MTDPTDLLNVLLVQDEKAMAALGRTARESNAIGAIRLLNELVGFGAGQKS